MPDLFRQIGNFICLALLQILVLNKMHLFDVATPFVYFYVLLKLPSSVSRNGLLLWGFCSGLVVDTFSDTPGMNAAATTLLAFVRPRLLSLYMNKADLEEYVPGTHTVGFGFFLRYCVTAVLLHHIVLFCVQSFSFAEPGMLFLRIGGSSMLSIVFLLVLDFAVRDGRMRSSSAQSK